MIIENSSFQSYAGIPIISSLTSEMTLKNSSFINGSKDYGLVPLQCLGKFIDMGNNLASNYKECNGAYVGNLLRCISFQAQDDVIAKHTTTTAQNHIDFLNIVQISACSKFHVQEEPCINVTSFSSLIHIVYKADTGSTLWFCPFVVTKTENEVLYVEKELSFGCVGGECKITGPGHHFLVRNRNTKAVHIQGFTFERSTTTALQVLHTTELVLCSCTFTSNYGDMSRGSALLAERRTKSHIEDCKFENNFSSDMGGSVFNRGFMNIVSSTFRYNKGIGSAIAVAPWASLSIENSHFYENSYGPPILFHENTVIDLGGNMATDNDICNGILIQREKNLCKPFVRNQSDLVTPSLSPSISNHLTNQTNDELFAPTVNPSYHPISNSQEGYFNYDPMDDVYGPSNWGEVRNNPEFLRYEELSDTLMRSLANKCDREDILQSPIDICEHKINAECYEHHQTRTHEGNMMFGDSITAQILPSKLRLKYHKNRTPEGGPYPPEGDFAHNWNGYAEVNHIDVKIPSEHTLCGKKFPGEFQIFMLHPLRRQSIVMSIFLDIDNEGNDNNHFQRAIDEWQKVYDANAFNCKLNYMKKENYFSEDPRSKVSNITGRILVEDDSPYGKGGWDPFHPSLQTSIYHWGYWGSLTEAPCSNFLAWRILTEPAFISERQLQQLRSILFTNVDRDQCVYSAVNDASIGVARPIQEFQNRPLYKCTSSDYVSDAEKAHMREETGNPNWCC